MVFDWLKKKLGGKQDNPNPLGLDERALKLLAEDVAELDSLTLGLADRTLRYILTGQGSEVLAALTGSSRAAQALKLRCQVKYGYGYPRKSLFAALDLRNGAFFLRLARVWEAAARAGKVELTLAIPGLEWLEIFLLEATGYQLNVSPSDYHHSPSIDALQIEAMLEADGQSPELLLRTLFFHPTTDFWKLSALEMLARLRGLEDRLLKRSNVVLDALAQPGAEVRVFVLDRLEKLKVKPDSFQARLAELAVSSSKQVRERSEAFLRQDPDGAIPLIEAQARDGGNDERIHAAKLLWRLRGEAARAFLEGRRPDEKNKRVLDAIGELLGTSAAGAAPAPALPSVTDVPVHAPISARAREALTACLAKVEAHLVKEAASRQMQPSKPLGPWAADAIADAMETLNLRTLGKKSPPSYPITYWMDSVWAPVREYCRHPDLAMIHVVRLAIALDALKLNKDLGGQIQGQSTTLIEEHQRSRPAPLSMRELAAVLKTVGLDPKMVGITRLQSFFRPERLGTPEATAWEYFAEHLDLIKDALAPGGDYWQSYRRSHALEILSTFPQPPQDLVPLLWEIALSPRKERLDVQPCLERQVEARGRIIAALSGGKAEARAAAAEWLARLKEKAAVEPLLAAVRKERNEAAKGALMLALEQLGVPVDQFIDRKALAEEARKGLSKGVPEALAAFPFATLPAVHWTDDGSLVDPEIIRWFLVQACKLKDPEPGVLLRRYAALFKGGEREVLGESVLAAWITLDTAPITRAQAEASARAEAQNFVQWSKMPNSGLPQKTEEEFYADALPRYLRMPKGSAIEVKGVLALAGACGGPQVAPAAGRYIRDWYGLRGAQSKALIQMLAWVEHPTAVQLVLAVGNRFRTKGIQEEAARQAQAIAERRGWTLEELADRTIPSAGLDENGEMILDFGPRRFTLRLGQELELVLTDEEGKALSSLPDPRAGDDATLAAEAKKLFSSSKKELKATLKMQGERLYEAMCIQRSWSFDDWDRYLNRHPVVRHLCRRLIWHARREDAVVTFRPLDDGSLTDVGENPVVLSPDHFVSVAHDCTTPADAARAWAAHYADYEVEPVFQQFGRPPFALTEERKRQTAMEDFLGHVVDAFSLRNRATKLGYTRGQAQDGGWFYDYHKRFPTLGLEAIIEFSGNGMPEENRKVALKSLSFGRIREGADINDHPRLCEIPAVLLAETWNDLRGIAADGSGFDPDWEKKTQP